MPSPTTERSVVDVLRAARERISEEERWVREAYAVDPAGEVSEPNSPVACRWCATGAIRAELNISGEEEPMFLDEVEVFLRQAALLLAPDGLSCPVDINDEAGHAATLRMFDAAIELAEAEQT